MIKLKITDEAIDKYRKLVENSMKIKNFGNARWVRNSFDNILLKHSTNTKDSINEEELITITEKDIDIEDMKKSQNSTKQKFGFDIEKKDNKENIENKTNSTSKEIFNVEVVEEIDKL